MALTSKFFKTPLIPKCIQQLETKSKQALPALGFYQ